MLENETMIAKFGPKVALDIFYRGKDISETNMLITTDQGGRASRDEVFYEVLKMFNEEPIKILQAGAIESFDSSFRFGSGWSDIFFANYMMTFSFLRLSIFHDFNTISISIKFVFKTIHFIF